MNPQRTRQFQPSTVNPVRLTQWQCTRCDQWVGVPTIATTTGGWLCMYCHRAHAN